VHYKLGVSGVWYGLTLGLMAASILLFVRFQVMSRKFGRI